MRRHVLLAILLAAVAAGCAPQAERGVLYQASAVNALVEGLYDGHTTLAHLLKRGDLGIGTLDALDGELILLDGRAYQVRADGKVYRPGPDATTPFATVTFFSPGTTIDIDGPLDFVQLQSLLDKTLPSKNFPLAVRITGRFKYVKTRSLPRQAKPYPRLVEVTRRQPTFEFHDVRGTLVGFRCPDYMTGLNIPGHHLHFLTADGAGGGHVLELEIEAVRAEAGYVPEVRVALPREGEFGKANIGGNKSADIERAEK